MIDVILIKTKGCESCSIMINIFCEVIKHYKNNDLITFHIYNYSDLKNNLLKLLSIKDFPTIIINYVGNINNSSILEGVVPAKTVIDNITKYIQ